MQATNQLTLDLARLGLQQGRHRVDREYSWRLSKRGGKNWQNPRSGEETGMPRVPES